jgi:2,3-bisphosphoglycerate-independent phosphoglycerate mutase
MVAKASTPNLDFLRRTALVTQLKAHGRAVGMPTDDDMGNSEVGHNAIGAGRVFDQGALLVRTAVESGTMFQGANWKYLVDGVIANDSKFHLIGLLSDGNVHSHIDILLAIIRRARQEGIRKLRVHALLDGRDVPPNSAHEYVERLESMLAEINASGEFDYCIASGGGRLYITMDRYNADWPMVARGWKTHVLGQGRPFASAAAAIHQLRTDQPRAIDQDLKEFVIHRNGQPVGRIEDGDSVVLFNFRGDRAIEISRAFDDPDLQMFDRGPIPNVRFAGIMEYDPDERIPKRFLVEPPAFDDVMGEYLAATGLRQLAVSETQKFGHVTYFFNGNRSGKFSDELEDYVEIRSDNVPFQQRPWMRAAEITDAVLESISSCQHDFIRLNYPNGDMVGHTGDLSSVEIAVESVDLCVGRLIHATRRANGILIVTADHGNADEMYQLDKDGKVAKDKDGIPKIRTSHSLNPVPCYIDGGLGTMQIAVRRQMGISSLAATVIECMGFEPPEQYDPSIIAPAIGNDRSRSTRISQEAT